MEYDRTNYAYVDETSPVPAKLHRISGAGHKRIIIPTNRSSDMVLELKIASTQAHAIFLAIASGLVSRWFVGLSAGTKRNYYGSVSSFLDWINEVGEGVLIGHSIIKDYEAYEVNERKRKPQSCGTPKIKLLIENGRELADLDSSSKRFLKNVIFETKLSVADPPEAHSLNRWFLRQSWLRERMGDDYLRLESSKQLISSFKVTISASLIYLLIAKRELAGNRKKNHYWSAYKYHKSPNKNNLRISKLVSKTVSFDKTGVAADPLSNLIWQSSVIYKHQERLIRHIQQKGVSTLPEIVVGLSKSYPFRTPLRSYIDPIRPTRLEEILCYWLCASLAVQPSDARLLKRNNIATEKNKNGRILFFEITYHKGRAGKKYSSPMLKGSNIISQAVLSYLEALPEGQENLFSRTVAKHVSFSNPFYSKRINIASSEIGILAQVWDSPHFKCFLYKLYRQNRSTDIFIKAMMSLWHEQNIDFLSWRSAKKGRSLYQDYLKDVDFPLPQIIFGATHIKNTAVYATSDKYRDGDLVNQNSHSTLTEKLSYLTDDNKDWTNQVGRITRMVMDDIQVGAYKPSLSATESAAREKILQTKMILNDLPRDAKINHYGEVEEGSTHDDDLYDQVIVIDSQNTALVMMHYISEADRYKNKLSERNPQLFAETVLVNVEWMHFCLSQMSPHNVSSARKKYHRIKAHLPGLFEGEVEGGAVV